MSRRVVLPLVCFFAVALLLAACKQKESEVAAPAAQSTSRAPYFKTAFQDESQFIVECIVSDLAQQMYYAVHQHAPDTKEFRVSATEKRGSPEDTPEYSLQVRFDGKMPEVSSDLTIGGPIWSPSIYQALASKLAGAVGLSAAQSGETNESGLLPKLTDNSAETIAREDIALSSSLEKDFRNPQSHEKAAMLLGAFLFRDHSGHFFDLREPLSLMTAHLVMAQFLGGGRPFSINGQLAEATLLTLINAEKPAVQRLDSIATTQPEVEAFIRALRCRATGDYREIGALKNSTPVERVEYFCSKANYADTAPAWRELTRAEKRTIDFIRTADQERYSVEMGHELLQVALQLESGEIGAVYEITHGQKLKSSAMIEALNELPNGCFGSDSAGQTHVQVIGWSHWAPFLQKHLCHAIQQNYHFMADMWGVPDEAKQFADKVDPSVSGLRLYPFLRRFDCSTVGAYHKSVDEGFAMTVATPQLVPADCWNYLCYKVNFAPLYTPVPNPHINQWFRHDPPPGTAYDLNPRLHHANLHDDPDALRRMEKLHELAPYDNRITSYILNTKYNGKPTHDQAVALFGSVLPYSVLAMRKVAGTVLDRMDDYEKLMIPAAKLDPACYYDLGDYFIEQNNQVKAAAYFDQGCEADPDAVRAASYSVWRVQHFLRTGQIEKARAVADEAGEVYSYRGLEAKGLFLEGITNYDGAFEWFSKIEERYNKSLPLVAFCLRYESATGNHTFAPEVKKRLSTLFPNGVENVTLNNFHIPPADGVLIREENDLLRAAGLKSGNVIVAVYGIRVHSMLQYMYGRELKQTPELDLIVWQGDAYREFKPSPPKHRFGVQFDDYVRRNNNSR